MRLDQIGDEAGKWTFDRAKIPLLPFSSLLSFSSVSPIVTSNEFNLFAIPCPMVKSIEVDSIPCPAAECIVERMLPSSSCIALSWESNHSRANSREESLFSASHESSLSMQSRLEMRKVFDNDAELTGSSHNRTMSFSFVSTLMLRCCGK